MTILTTKEEIDTFRLLSLRGALRLEIAGMKRRGSSAASIAKQELQLPVRTPNAVVLEKLNALIEQRQKAGQS